MEPELQTGALWSGVRSRRWAERAWRWYEQVIRTEAEREEGV